MMQIRIQLSKWCRSNQAKLVVWYGTCHFNWRIIFTPNDMTGTVPYCQFCRLDPLQSEKSDPDPQQNEKPDLDTHLSVADPQHCMYTVYIRIQLSKWCRSNQAKLVVWYGTCHFNWRIIFTPNEMTGTVPYYQFCRLDPLQSEKSDQDPPQNEKPDLDTHLSVADPQHCMYTV